MQCFLQLLGVLALGGFMPEQTGKSAIFHIFFHHLCLRNGRHLLLSFIAPPTFSFQMFLCPMSLKMQDINEVVTLLCDCGKMLELNKKIGDYS
jgi:hypothetical protein